jgi:protein-disulfide isomerase
VIARVLSAAFMSTAAFPATPALIEGRQDSPVQVIIYEDLQCADCAAFRRMMDAMLLSRYSAKVAFVHHDFPIPRHAWARKAAVAGRFFAAHASETGLAWRQYIMAAIPETNSSNFETKLSGFVARHSLDPGQAVAALTESRYTEPVERDYAEGVARGVSRTPTVFVNGKPFVETFSFDEIAKAIDDALAKAH